MDLNPPEGSKVWIASEGGDATIVVPPASGFGRYFVGFFLLFWLGMWTIGFRDAATKIMSGATNNGFLVFWLGAWTLGGAIAVYTLYRAFRPSVPETLGLKRNSVAYDSGVAPPQFNSYWGYRNPKDSWNYVFPKRGPGRTGPKPAAIVAPAGNRIRQPLDRRCRRSACRDCAHGQRGRARVAGSPLGAALFATAGIWNAGAGELKTNSMPKIQPASAFAIARKSCHDIRL